MWTTKTENDSMNMTIVITLCTGAVYHMDEFHWEVMGNQDTQAHYFFVQYKTAMAPSIWYTRWQPMQHPPLFIVYTLTSEQRSSAAKSFNLLYNSAEKGRMGKEEDRLVWRLKENVSVFALLWFFVRPMGWPWFGAGLLGWFLGRLGTRPPGSFGCARWWWSSGTNRTLQLQLKVSTLLTTLQLIKENGDCKVKPIVNQNMALMTTLGEALGRSYLLEDFLLLDRGESLWVEREDVSLEYERSERSDLSDRSERGEFDRPRLLLVRVGLGDPLWRRFLSTREDKYLSEIKQTPCFINSTLTEWWRWHDTAACQLVISPLFPGWCVLLLFFLLQVFQPCFSFLLFFLLPLSLPFKFLLFFFLQ